MSNPTSQDGLAYGTEADTHLGCSQEQIHIPGAIQPHGALLAIDPLCGFTVIAASRNAAGLLTGAAAPGGIIGRTTASILGADFAASVRQRLENGGLRGEAPWQSTLNLADQRHAFEVSVHAHAGLILVELEPAGAQDEAVALASVRQLRETIVELRGATGSVEELARIATRGLRSLTGYERVLVYRFDADWNGASIGEDKTADWDESLDGLIAPAFNIPAQARELYRRSPMRWIADMDAKSVPLDIDPAWTRDQPSPHAIDLSFAHLRSNSPVHRRFQRGIGVHGSLSLSILHDGRLWGTMICHHRKMHHLSPGQRTTAVALTDAFALRVGLAERTATEQARRGDLARLSTLLAHMAEAEIVTLALTTGDATIDGLFASTGAAVVYDGELTLLGRTPPRAEMLKLIPWLWVQNGTVKQFQTNNLSTSYPAWKPHTAIASGLLAVFLSPGRPDMLLWLRPEEPQLVSWGGNPHDDATGDPSNPPRVSFERWVEMRHGARPWAEWELEIAETLRHGVTEVIVRSLRHRARIEASDQARKTSEAALRRSNEVLEASTQAHLVQQEGEARFRFATEAGRLGVWELDLQTYELTASAVFKENFSHDRDTPFTYAEMQAAVHPDDRRRIMAAIALSVATGVEYDIECRVMRPGETTGWVQMHAQVVHAADGIASRMAGISLDITERVQTEERVRQGQRLEAVGQLTAGVAHDFNNVLQVLLGSLELAIGKLEDRSDVCATLERALHVGQRGARLTSHLLSFSRMQALRPTTVELPPLFAELSHTLEHTLGQDIAISIDTAPGLPPVLVDATHLDAALLNLALNARDAMHHKGKLRIEATATGEQVVIAVTDTGEGMTPEVLSHACEPFYSTKGTMGSGLGLSMVQGFARQSGGELRIQSATGQGTRVEIWLPKAVRPTVAAPALRAKPLRGSGRLLVVDDDLDVGGTTAALLSEAGFDVTMVGGGRDALDAMGASLDFDALVTDYVMPGMNGGDLVLQARALHHDLPAMVITGYATAEGLERLPSDVTILRKPFQREEIVRRINVLVKGRVTGAKPRVIWRFRRAERGSG